MNRWSRDETGISPVVGAILMIAITVTLAAVVGLFMFGLEDSLSSPQSTAGVEVTERSSTVVVTLIDTGGADRIHAVVNGTVLHTWNTSEVGKQVSITGLSADGRVTILAEQDGKNRTLVSHAVESETGLNSDKSPHVVSDDGGDTSTTPAFYVSNETTLMRYASDGSVAWSTTFVDIQGIDSGPNGGAYVVVNTSNENYTLYKLDSSGSELWSTTQAKASNDSAHAVSDIAVDSNGNAYVTEYSGFGSQLVAFGGSGSVRWVNSTYAGDEIAATTSKVALTDWNGNVHSLYSNETLRWSNTTYEGMGTAYVSGPTIHNGSVYSLEDDARIRRHDTSTGDADESFDISAGDRLAIGSDEGMYVGASGSPDTVKRLTSSGAVDWTKNVTTSAPYPLVTSDGTGVVTVDGTTIVKYASDGSVAWNRSVGLTPNDFALAG